ncbi:hypothetical protein BDY24DRAFT_99545 [Mrakia frigida]|uniref:uncharacterized protein n=1 Tax=Mrakia frigida TaxID=29902 RepID=UPI003FCC1DF1
MFPSSRWRGSSFPSRPSRVLPLLFVVSLVLAFPLQVQAANETDAENAEETSARVKAAALTQGTDGGSGAMGFVWAAFCILIGLPLLTAGLKLMRLTCGAGLGLVLCFVVWLSFVNSSPTNGFASTPFLSDVLITIPTLVLSALALGLGLFRPARYVGHNLLCLAGGIAFVLQLMLFREGLLIPIREVIWGLVGLAAILGLVLGVWRQRVGVLSMSSMAGSFLLSLGVDLIINKQQGMSFGLRVIFDDNSAHETLLVRTNYKPTLSTQIILGVGLAFA